MSQVLIAAIPKSGNNMMQKACHLLGVEAEYAHTTNYHLADTRRCIYIYRNPRNVLVSALRYRNHQRRGYGTEITTEKLIDVFYDFFNNSLPSTYQAYSKWMGTNAHIVRFEDFISNPGEFDKLADYLQVPRRPEAYKELSGGTATWTGSLSDWTQHWSPELDAHWIANGMPEIEHSLGYGDWKPEQKNWMQRKKEALLQLLFG